MNENTMTPAAVKMPMIPKASPEPPRMLCSTVPLAPAPESTSGHERRVVGRVDVRAPTAMTRTTATSLAATIMARTRPDSLAPVMTRSIRTITTTSPRSIPFPRPTCECSARNVGMPMSNPSSVDGEVGRPDARDHALRPRRARAPAPSRRSTPRARRTRRTRTCRRCPPSGAWRTARRTTGRRAGTPPRRSGTRRSRPGPAIVAACLPASEKMPPPTMTPDREHDEQSGAENGRAAGGGRC